MKNEKHIIISSVHNYLTFNKFNIIVIRISLVALNVFNASKTKHLYELKLNKIISYNFTVELSNKQSAFSKTYFQVLSAFNNRTTNANKALASPDLYAIFSDVGGSIFRERTKIILLCSSEHFLK